MASATLTGASGDSTTRLFVIARPTVPRSSIKSCRAVDGVVALSIIRLRSRR
jgi:hypothetical protein